MKNRLLAGALLFFCLDFFADDKGGGHVAPQTTFKAIGVVFKDNPDELNRHRVDSKLLLKKHRSCFEKQSFTVLRRNGSVATWLPLLKADGTVVLYESDQCFKRKIETVKSKKKNESFAAKLQLWKDREKKEGNRVPSIFR